MVEVDLDLRPALEAEAAGTLVCAVTQQSLGPEDAASARLAAADPLQLTQLLQRVDPNVRVGADAERDTPVRDAGGGEEAVREVGLGGEAGAHGGAGVGEQVELGAVGVRGVHDGHVRTEAPGLFEQLDRPAPVLGEALLDLLRLFVGVHVEGQPLGGGVAADLLQPASLTGADRVGGKADRNSGAAQLLELAQVVGDRGLPHALEPAAAVRSEQQDEHDACLIGRFHGSTRLGEPQIVKLADRGVPGVSHLAVRRRIEAPDRMGSLPLGLGEHHVTPLPEVPAPGATAQRPLEGVRVSVHEAGQPECLAHRLYPFSMATRVVPAPLTRIPNALTLLRLALIPLFVALFIRAEDGSSWAAGWVFLVAGVTDQVDGWLARRWRVESQFGKLADPLADRLMIDAAVILLAVEDKLPWPAALVVVGRDVLLVGGYKLLVPQGYELSVSKLGKAATWLLYLSVGLLVVVGQDTEWPLWLFWVALALALVAAAQYVAKARREVRS
jgi:CDP-diacylglycerol--glycerol-3-phosphate 3-phosphatidyltransferase